MRHAPFFSAIINRKEELSAVSYVCKVQKKMDAFNKAEQTSGIIWLLFPSQNEDIQHQADRREQKKKHGRE